MAKSLRSKVKRSYRSKKRDDSIYAATEAARLQRLNAKLRQTIETDVDGDVQLEDDEAAEEEAEKSIPADKMDIDNSNSAPKKISTHGPRGSRREEWRKSKGMSARPASKSMNRQGGISARRKAGRSHRRR